MPGEGEDRLAYAEELYQALVPCARLKSNFAILGANLLVTFNKVVEAVSCVLIAFDSYERYHAG